MKTGSDNYLTSFFDHCMTNFSVSVVEIEGVIKIHEIRFVKNDTCNDNMSPHQAIAEIGGRINLFLDGKEVDFSEYELDMRGMGEFEQQVIRAARTIPRGETISYTKLAQIAGHGSAVRAVASVMRRNRFPIIVPCHRVVRKSGETGGFCGKIDGEFVDLKRRLIGLEKKGECTKYESDDNN